MTIQKLKAARLIITAALILFPVAEVCSQFRLSPRETFKEAFDFFSYGEYEEALPMFLSLLGRDPENNHVRYLAGVSYLNIEGQRQRALPLLKEAAGYIVTDHITGSFEERNAPADCLYYLGIAFRLAYRFEESLESFEKLHELLGNRYDLLALGREISRTKNAVHFIENRETIIIINDNDLPGFDPFHSNIVISGNESVIVYTEPQRFYDAVFYIKKEEHGWSRPTNITMQLGSDGLAYPVSLSWEGKELYLYQFDGFSSTNIYRSIYSGNRWSAMENLGKNINTQGYEQHASVTRDGREIYFSSDRAEGFGGFDIYRSVRNENMEWGPAKNLGETVNSAFDDTFPFISPDGDRLYFSSSGHTGIGGLDIFVTEKLDSGEWSPPRNLGYPVNTPDDDSFLIPVADGTTAFFSMRTSNNNDIREFRRIGSFDVAMNSSAITRIKTVFNNEGLRETELMTKTVYRLTGNDTVMIKRWEGAGEYTETELDWGKYLVEVKVTDTENRRFELSIPEYYPDPSYEISTIFDLPETTPGKPEKVDGPPETVILELEPVLFRFDSNNVGLEYIPMIKEVAQLLIRYEETEVELAGYTDSMGPEIYNKYLSGLRAEAVAAIFAEKGIETGRITITAAGMKNYIASNTTADGRDNPEGRRFNRRVEILITGFPEYIVLRNTLEIPDHLKIDNP